eukprot:CAMPEP_0172302484 /NCGR_PEP_ID=MMETSP1058-20130122/4190_1 /TAXON_ID=83371 /ORGANISM="Detonula confervacea, Strain CCMP 353" /LENGTH=375 /DNA_ID=CAMNT_0013012989 /DNA_START=277 /DNA_END=1405 /DNA_ORIENTATION=+
MTYRGVTYNIPIDMYLPPPYPSRPPTVFVRPVASMAIKKNHRHVGMDGQVYLSYLHEWKPTTHELGELAMWMSSLFGSEPPCYAKPVNASSSNGSAATNGQHNPPPYSQATTTVPLHSHTSSQGSSAYSSISTVASSTIATSITDNNAIEERRRVIAQEVADANLAVETARRADAEEAQMEADRRRIQKEHEGNLSSMRAMATSKVQFEIQTLFQGMKEELRLELKNQKQLEAGKEQVEHLIKEGDERKAQLQKGNEEIEESIEGLEKWLAAVKEQQNSSADIDNNNTDNGQTKADLMALPADTHSAQMLALSSENAAIDDCIYFLDRALVQGSISPEVFLKEVRRLSKRQFLAKAHLIKIAKLEQQNIGDTDIM